MDTVLENINSKQKKLWFWAILPLFTLFALPGCQNRQTVVEPTSVNESNTIPADQHEQPILATVTPLVDNQTAADPPATLPPVQPTSEQATPQQATLDPLPTIIVDSAPAPEPIGTVELYEGSITLPTYPFENYQSDLLDPTFNLPYKQFDYERFRAENPLPVERIYRTIILENNYLQLIILPELGGRLWQVIHKASGNRMFYQNDVVKPSPWGPAEQLGWLAIGGLEWNLPVIEHGYDWGAQWGFSPVQHSPESATVTLFTPWDGRFVSASIAISLRAGAANFEIQPTISNLGKTELEFDYWHSAMLAPGPQNSPSDDLHFVLPAKEVIVHSTGDATLPLPADPLSWPIYNDRDVSTLGSWAEYAGFFESPAAAGPFAAVYDRQYDAGAARIFPADVARGSKIFSPGWSSPLLPSYYTDDESRYVELHGGLSPSFFEQYRLPAGGSVTWREVWYPVQGIGDLKYANEVAAVQMQPSADGLEIGFYPTRPLDGNLLLFVNGAEVQRLAITASPDLPFTNTIPIELMGTETLELRFEDSAGRTLLAYRSE